MNTVNTNNETKHFFTYEDLKNRYNNSSIDSFDYHFDFQEATKESVRTKIISIYTEETEFSLYTPYKIMKKRLANINDVKILEFIKNYSQLFKNSVSSYAILNSLLIIYNLNIKHTSNNKYFTNDEKTALLQKSFDVFKNLEYRDEICNNIITQGDDLDDLHILLLYEKTFLESILDSIEDYEKHGHYHVREYHLNYFDDIVQILQDDITQKIKNNISTRDIIQKSR